ncbi:MAG: integrase core domain protein [Massilia sp.]|nr:integrase core domain protein [Massilia sp.]
MIADANRYEPRSNDAVLDFARRYGTSILPARPHHPQDRAKAESAVQVVERRIIARLRHQQFGSAHEVNEAIAPLCTRLDDKPFKQLPGSRASTFAEIDAPALLSLPLQRYKMVHFKTVKVHIDYHVEVERHRYSVPTLASWPSTGSTHHDGPLRLEGVEMPRAAASDRLRLFGGSLGGKQKIGHKKSPVHRGFFVGLSRPKIGCHLRALF